jgi:hypothetical protein
METVRTLAIIIMKIIGVNMLLHSKILNQGRVINPGNRLIRLSSWVC